MNASWGTGRISVTNFAFTLEIAKGNVFFVENMICFGPFWRDGGKKILWTPGRQTVGWNT